MAFKMKGWSGYQNSPAKEKIDEKGHIVRGRKKHLQDLERNKAAKEGKIDWGENVHQTVRMSSGASDDFSEDYFTKGDVKRARKEFGRGSEEVKKAKELKKEQRFYAYPTMTLEKDPITGEFSSEKVSYGDLDESTEDPHDIVHGTVRRDAEAKGELYSFKSKRKADKFAHGSWKQGEDRKRAMEEYRKGKKRKKLKKKYEKRTAKGKSTERLKKRYVKKGGDVKDLE